MLFNSFIFFAFLGVVLPVFYAIPGKTGKNSFLLLASYFFYGYWDWRFCSLLAISTIIDYTIGLNLARTNSEGKRKQLLFISLAANLGILGFFKYFNFFIDSFHALSQSMGWSLDHLHLNIILPVGISFYTFQTLSYTIDIYRRKVEPTRNFIDFALFVAFFPQLVAGPIERAKQLLPQLSRKLQPSKTQLRDGVKLIILGLFRKVMIGDTSGRIVDQVFGNIALYNSFELITALILFSIQIYADFSGYSHIARGTAKLLGVDIVRNFEQPYLSRNITEFWRRWHVSLSSWLKEYLYFSLGGNRKGEMRTYFNLMITMLLGGLWHGASWNFVVWGGIHGIYLAIHKMMLGKRKVSSSNNLSLRGRDVFNVVATFILVLITWLFFRSPSWDSTVEFIQIVMQFEGSEYLWHFGTMAITFLSLTFILDWVEYRSGSHTSVFMIKSVPAQYGVLLALFLTTLVFMFQSKPLPFIYFQF